MESAQKLIKEFFYLIQRFKKLIKNISEYNKNKLILIQKVSEKYTGCWLMTLQDFCNIINQL